MNMIDEEKYRKYLCKKLAWQIESGKNKFAPYPNGDIASLVKKILWEQYNKKIEFAVDAKHFDGNAVLNLEQAKERTTKEIF